MPQIGLPLLLSIIGTGVGVGTSAYELASKPSTPKAPTVTPAVQALEQQQTQNAQKSAVSQQIPNVLAQTSGLANPAYVSTISQLLAGTSGQSGSAGGTQDLIRQIFGIGGGGGGGGFTPSGTAPNNPNAAAMEEPNLSDFLQRSIYS